MHAGVVHVARASEPRNPHGDSATPAGFESPRNPVKLGDDRVSPTDEESAEVVSPRLIAESGRKVARLALVAMNALQNGDLHRALEVLQGIHHLCSSPHPARRPRTSLRAPS
jgi:hypothetical protein